MSGLEIYIVGRKIKNGGDAVFDYLVLKNTIPVLVMVIVERYR